MVISNSPIMGNWFDYLIFNQTRFNGVSTKPPYLKSAHTQSLKEKSK